MERLQDIGQILALCVRMTNLKLEDSCGFDRQFAAQWYENEYLTGKHTRYVMKPDLSITSYEDGKVYRAFNCDDAKAVELMEANPEYIDYFIDLDAAVTTIPELGDDPFAQEQTEPEQTEPEQTEPEQTEPTQTEPTQTEPEQTEPTPEEIAEAEAAAKRSEAAKKAAATRAAKKAAAEAAADISEFE
ncbi:hypothetical protein BC679P5_00016 [Bacteroides phage BC679P5]|nr:hypothetical protein BC679P5_00016 [Bacteroides phage BC679P5]